ncbi:DNA-processing protein DprA [Gryllotalpicola protaetiae]|uniref:DNA-protecting protein DprA n=1 Tax=Gryllotalpicola protaetiae TaxID=2419771 RepID=A0A387BMB3_9MICO|nr:DNA-processing protein DprA [Gryllotalpicola protaetiae]AYG02127.1 DNA-protecting protein DprA [Gryllotalpicola protaetiae]
MTISVGMSERERAALWDRLRPGRLIDDRELTARVVWSVLAEPGDGTAGRLVEDLGAAASLELVYRAVPFPSPAELRRGAAAVRDTVTSAYRARGVEPLAGVHAGFLRWQPRMDPTLIASVFSMAAASAAELLTPDDPQWSRGLRDLGPHAPLVLWALGNVELLRDFETSVAMVGTRAATGYGNHVAAEFAAGLAERGWTVVSGGAYGIDAASHRAALAAKGLTVAVMAGGLHSFYPVGNSELIARIAREGLVLAEVPFGTPPTPFRFLARNRMIAAMTSAVVVIEAGSRSGSINTANHAFELERPIGVVPGAITSPSSAGCHEILKTRPSELVTSVDDIVRLAKGSIMAPEPLADPEDPRYTRVLAALHARSARSVATIAQKCGIGEGETAGLLGVLLLDGVVRKTEAGWVSVPPKR